MRVVLLGAGGHAQVVADILWRMRDAGQDIQPVAYLDDNPALHGQVFLNVQVLGSIDFLPSIEYEAVIVAVGNNRSREKSFLNLQGQGIKFAIARHPTAVIAPDVEIGPGVMICANVVVNTGSIIGQNAILNTACTVDHHNQIGAHAHVAPGVHLGGDAQIGEGVLMGIGSILLPQRRVGPWSTVGGGAVVVKDVKAGETVIGYYTG